LLDYILHHVWILQVYHVIIKLNILACFSFSLELRCIFPFLWLWIFLPTSIPLNKQQIYIYIYTHTIYIKLCHYWCNGATNALFIIGVWYDILCNGNKTLKSIESGESKIWCVIHVWLIKKIGSWSNYTHEYVEYTLLQSDLIVWLINFFINIYIYILLISVNFTDKIILTRLLILSFLYSWLH